MSNSFFLFIGKRCFYFWQYFIKILLIFKICHM
nr:MAG TPA: hypothetical protein [Caudoviricetes sp.]